VIIKLLSSLNGHIMHMLEHRGSQAEGMTSTAAGSALDLRSAAASWAPHAGLFCQLIELGLRGSRDVPRVSDVMELFVITMADSKKTGWDWTPVQPGGSISAWQPPAAAADQPGVQPDKIHADTGRPPAATP